MHYWHTREVSDRLRAERERRQEPRSRQLPDAIGFWHEDWREDDDG